MADPFTWISIIGTGASFLGSMNQASAQASAGRAQQAESDYEAAQLTQNAGQARASAQRDQIEQERRGMLAKSRATNLQAGQGGSTSDVSFIDTVSGIDAETEYNSLNAVYQGEDKAQGMEAAAAGKTYEGATAADAGRTAASSTRLSAFGSLFSSGKSLVDKYAPRTSSASTGLYGSYDNAGTRSLGWT